MERRASAVWQGNLKEGKGTISTESGVLKQTSYSFAKRFGDDLGTNPEELLAAAHAGCFTMALSSELGKLGITPNKIESNATITLEQNANGFSVTKSHLVVKADVPGIDQKKFETAVNSAATECPVSKLFKAEITVDAQLAS